jgi:hypothetical protein
MIAENDVTDMVRQEIEDEGANRAEIREHESAEMERAEMEVQR